MRSALLLACLLVTPTARADSSVSAAVQPPLTDGDRAFQVYVQEQLGKWWPDHRVAAWYSANLDEDAALERVAVICPKTGESLGFYMIEKDAKRRWQLMFEPGWSQVCDQEANPPVWDRRQQPAIVHVQEHEIDDPDRPSRLIQKGYERVYFALRKGVPVVVREELLDDAQTRVRRTSTRLCRAGADGHFETRLADFFTLGRLDQP